MKSPAPALEVRGLTKHYEKPAVDGLDLTLRAGEFYALLGPNGAGKTTTLRIVAGLLRPDAGTVSVLGIDALADPITAKRVTAWVSDEPMIYDKLTPFEYLEFVAGLWHIDAADAQKSSLEIIDWLGLTQEAHTRCQYLSKGMRQKVALAGALGARTAQTDYSRRTANRPRCRLGPHGSRTLLAERVRPRVSRLS